MRLSCNRVPADELQGVQHRAVLNLAGCLWARLDGKSPIDYLVNESRRATVRGLARRWLYEAPLLEHALTELRAEVGAL